MAFTTLQSSPFPHLPPKFLLSLLPGLPPPSALDAVPSILPFPSPASAPPPTRPPPPTTHRPPPSSIKQRPPMSTADITRAESSKMGEEAGGGGDDGKPPKGTAYLYTPAQGVARSLCLVILILVVLAGITALVLYLVYRPSKPRFGVAAAAVYELNSTAAPTFVTALVQLTVVIHNPNDRSSIAYERLVAYVTNRGEAITPPAPLPPLFQDPDSTVAVSPVLGGGPVPVSSGVTGGLAGDRAYGAVALRLVVMGRLRYKAGPFRSAWTRVFVRCDLLLGVHRGVQGPVPLLGTPDCEVDT